MSEVEIKHLPESAKVCKKLAQERRRLTKLREEGSYTKRTKLEEAKREVRRARRELDLARERRRAKATDLIMAVKAGELDTLDKFISEEAWKQ